MWRLFICSLRWRNLRESVRSKAGRVRCDVIGAMCDTLMCHWRTVLNWRDWGHRSVEVYGRRSDISARNVGSWRGRNAGPLGLLQSLFLSQGGLLLARLGGSGGRLVRRSGPVFLQQFLRAVIFGSLFEICYLALSLLLQMIQIGLLATYPPISNGGN